MSLKQQSNNWFVSTLHKASVLRTFAKQLFRGTTLKQKFHNGIICLDAVEHSWAWTGSRRYETFDRELQDYLLSLSRDYEMLIDIGSNLGAISLSVCLRNPNIKAVCIDPNARVISLLKESIRHNRLQERIEVIEAAVSDKEGEVTFDESGSVTGHISDLGRQVKTLDFAKLINEYSSKYKCLVKIDVEGFETVLLKQLISINITSNICFAIELHPLNFNEVGEPKQCLDMLIKSGATLEDIHGNILTSTNAKHVTQVIAKWSEK